MPLIRMGRLFASVLWPAICVAGVWFALTGSLISGAIIALAVLSAVTSVSGVSKR
jgi:hypothetical protein